eukprot:980400-Pelagomonas_calceolata.AAC.2
MKLDVIKVTSSSVAAALSGPVLLAHLQAALHTPPTACTSMVRVVKFDLWQARATWLGRGVGAWSSPWVFGKD